MELHVNTKEYKNPKHTMINDTECKLEYGDGIYTILPKNIANVIAELQKYPKEIEVKFKYDKEDNKFLIYYNNEEIEIPITYKINKKHIDKLGLDDDDGVKCKLGLYCKKVHIAFSGIIINISIVRYGLNDFEKAAFIKIKFSEMKDKEMIKTVYVGKIENTHIQKNLLVKLTKQTW
jgi:hypothetical protein